VPRARHTAGAAFVLLLLVLSPRAASAQPLAPEPPGGLTFDIRGTTLGVPQTSDFYPDLPTDTIVPARGFGIEGGLQMYPWRHGSRSLGLGADLFWTRASATPTITAPDAPGVVTGIALRDVAVTTLVMSPQVSINFGSAAGWSYLTVGGGGAWVRSTAAQDEQTRAVADVNAGAGARWFLTDHVGVGFDLRMHWYGGSSLFAASAGFSLK